MGPRLLLYDALRRGPGFAVDAVRLTQCAVGRDAAHFLGRDFAARDSRYLLRPVGFLDWNFVSILEPESLRHPVSVTHLEPENALDSYRVCVTLSFPDCVTRNCAAILNIGAENFSIVSGNTKAPAMTSRPTGALFHDWRIVSGASSGTLAIVRRVTAVRAQGPRDTDDAASLGQSPTCLHRVGVAGLPKTTVAGVKAVLPTIRARSTHDLILQSRRNQIAGVKNDWPPGGVS